MRREINNNTHTHTHTHIIVTSYLALYSSVWKVRYLCYCRELAFSWLIQFI